jgi:DNA-binding HxlR family transcriptional regulator
VSDAVFGPGHPLVVGARQLGDRWVLLVLGVLRDGPRRFGQLQAALPGLAPNILSRRLARLERDGLVTANRYSHRPARYEYDLTPAGRAAAPVLDALVGWATGAPPADDPRGAGAGWADGDRLATDAVGADEVHEL